MHLDFLFIPRSNFPNHIIFPLPLRISTRFRSSHRKMSETQTYVMLDSRLADGSIGDQSGINSGRIEVQNGKSLWIEPNYEKAQTHPLVPRLYFTNSVCWRMPRKKGDEVEYKSQVMLSGTSRALIYWHTYYRSYNDCSQFVVLYMSQHIHQDITTEQISSDRWTFLHTAVRVTW